MIIDLEEIVTVFYDENQGKHVVIFKNKEMVYISKEEYEKIKNAVEQLKEDFISSLVCL